jgi:hypothetical protein
VFSDLVVIVVPMSLSLAHKGNLSGDALKTITWTAPVDMKCKNVTTNGKSSTHLPENASALLGHAPTTTSGTSTIASASASPPTTAPTTQLAKP